MTSDPAAPAGGLPRFEFAPHNCFACGSLNEGGLRLELHCELGRSWIETRLDGRFEGWDGIAHGGIVATILDEVMAWSLVTSDAWGVTARMAIEYRRPVPIGRPIRAEGRLLRDRRRLFETSAELRDAEGGELLATATAVYAAAGDGRRRELKERYGFRLVAESAVGAEPVGAEPATPGVGA